MFNLASTRMLGGFFAFNTKFLVLKLGCGFFVDPCCIVLHFTFLANQINIGIFSSRHNTEIN